MVADIILRPVGSDVNMRQTLLCLLAGIALVFAFAPFHVAALAILAPAVLLYVWLRQSSRQALCSGFCFGLGYFGFGVSWIYVSLHVYGYLPPLIAGALTALFVAVLALFPATLGLVFVSFRRRHHDHWLIYLSFPLLWVLWEWLRATLFTGFPWLSIGYSQIDTPLRAFAAIFSVYGVSFATLLNSSLLVACYGRRLYIRLVVMFGLLWGCAFVLLPIQWTRVAGPKVHVSLVQGNISQADKWQSAQRRQHMQIYADLALKNMQPGIMIWPESSITLTADKAHDFLQHMHRQAKRHQVSLLIGIPVRHAPLTSIYARQYNAMQALGLAHGQYLKRHLVPFGEYIPLRYLVETIFAKYPIPMSSFSSGAAKQNLIMLDNIPVASAICYEIAYPGLIADDMPQAQLIVTVSDDSWFGQSIAAAQHLQIARMRSVESGRYQLYSTNNGPSAVIDAQGRVQGATTAFTRTVLAGYIIPMRGLTPWIRIARS